MTGHAVRRTRKVRQKRPASQTAEATAKVPGMDPVSIAFYAVVCGILSVAAPGLGGVVSRMAVGAVVGIVAAALLPLLRGAAGF